MSLPKIVKTVFYVDPSHGRNYSFDVNNNTSFNELKSILSTAANVKKIGLKVYHKQTERDLTPYIDETLEEIFPNKDMVEFKISIDTKYKSYSPENLQLGDRCKQHPEKYMIFYCFECEQSLCSICVGTGSHKDHPLTEKFDYLKPSNHIVNEMFSDLDDLVDNVNNKTNEKELEDIKLKLTTSYFPSLIELLRKIEKKLNDQVDQLNKHCTLSIKTLKENKYKLKEHCTEGLDELKYQINIEKLLQDEGVFLHFDCKVREMSSEKDKFYEDTEKLNKILKGHIYIRNDLERIYSEIKKFLEHYLDIDLKSDLNHYITHGNIDELDKKGIFNRLLSEFKKQNGRIISDAKKGRFSTNSNFVSRGLGSTAFNLNSTIGGTNTNTTMISNFPDNRTCNFLNFSS